MKCSSNVRYWHKADIEELPANVAFGGKADIAPAPTQSGHGIAERWNLLSCGACYRLPLVVTPTSRGLLGLDAGGLNHLRPICDVGLDAAGEFFRPGVECIKAQRRELLSSFRLNHRLADLAMEQLYNWRRRVGGDKDARYRIGLLTGQSGFRHRRHVRQRRRTFRRRHSLLLSPRRKAYQPK
jgi:hypothetical protein